ncbi:MAG: hypothetical protein R6U44_05095 [Archaeoglobaceae archaeon]
MPRSFGRVTIMSSCLSLRSKKAEFMKSLRKKKIKTIVSGLFRENTMDRLQDVPITMFFIPYPAFSLKRFPFTFRP